MSACLILGGGGYIGFNWAKRLAERGRFDRIVLGDVRAPKRPLPKGCEFLTIDVRQPMPPALNDLKPEWIFNFAAVHREPGHARNEYFDTNLAGAKNTVAYAELSGCKSILFTSSIAVYGALEKPVSEDSLPYPYTPYGISKLCAELMHKSWRRSGGERKLFICRPGVIYGPGDPGNILRMVRAIRKGYFIVPGSRELRKSYGYIEGLLDSFEFMMARPENELTFNYVESETETLGTLVRMIQAHLGKRTPTFTAPRFALEAAAGVVQILTAGKSPIHPVRVRKTASSTHVRPETLKRLGFTFRYDFATSLKDWAAKAPEDFS